MDFGAVDPATLRRWIADPANAHVRPALERRLQEVERAGSVAPSIPMGMETAAPSKRRGVPNRTELRYAEEQLEPLLHEGIILRYEFEPITFHVHEVARYTPDWVAWLADGGLWCHEVKGGHIWTSAKIRFKAHSAARPWIRWTMVQRVKGGGWRTLHDRRPEAS